jgi:hypothetical protein
MCVVYYESIKRELKIKSIYECRYDERLQTKTRKSRASHTLGWPCVFFFFLEHLFIMNR